MKKGNKYIQFANSKSNYEIFHCHLSEQPIIGQVIRGTTFGLVTNVPKILLTKVKKGETIQTLTCNKVCHSKEEENDYHGKYSIN